MDWKRYAMQTLIIKKTGLAVLIYNKIGFWTGNITSDIERYFIMTRESIYQKDMTILNVYEPNNRDSKYLKQKLTEQKG